MDEGRFVAVATLADLRERGRLVVERDGHEILLTTLGGAIYAIGNICTHDEVWLDDGIVHAESCEIECPMHEGRFDLRTGAATHAPAEDPVPSYAVRVLGERVLVQLP